MTGDFVSNSPFYAANMKVRLVQTTVKYFIITNAQVVAGETFLTLDGQGKYTLANEVISSHLATTWSNPTSGFPLSDPAYSPSNHIHGYDAIVYADGSDIIAKDAFGVTLEEGTLGTNDAAVIQAAIDAGGAVLLAHASFTLEASLVISTSGVRLYAESRRVVLKAKDGLNDNMIEITGSGVNKVMLTNLTLDGNRGNQLSGNGIYINTGHPTDASAHLLQNIDINDPRGDGIVIEGATGCCKFDHITVMNADGTGYTIAGSDHVFYDLVAGACKSGGFNISAGSIKATLCKAFWCGETTGSNFYIVGDRGTYIGCEAQDGYANGWVLDGANNCLLANCVGDSNGTANDWQSGLVLYNCINILVSNGAFFDRQTPATQSWGVHVQGTSTGCVVTYPSYGGNVTADYYDESSGTNYEVLPA